MSGFQQLMLLNGRSFSFSLVAGTRGGGLETGFSDFASQEMGSLTPATLDGKTILELYTYNSTEDYIYVIGSPANGTVSQTGWFNTMIVEGVSYGAAAAVFQLAESGGWWRWPTTTNFVDGNTYPITFT